MRCDDSGEVSSSLKLLTRSLQEAIGTGLVSSDRERALLWRQDKRIVPLAAFIYFLCYLDRSNIGNAKVLNVSTGDDMQTETGMSNYQFNVALMIFLIGCELGPWDPPLPSPDPLFPVLVFVFVLPRKQTRRPLDLYGPLFGPCRNV